MRFNFWMHVFTTAVATDLHQVSAENVRPICLADFEKALSQVKSSVSDGDIESYLKWNRRYGSGT
jgi:SpoVK/Ycf46/Vps4 family AAA+-type ATPase